MPEPIDVRAEFDTFFASAYPWLASQVRAITGDADTARWAVDEAFVRCWRSWASVRRTADPMGWVRWTALRVAAGTRRDLPFRRRTAEPSAVTEGSEEAVVLDALLRLPASQRRAIVLHYMGDVTVAELARHSGTTPDAVEWLLDAGFDALVGLLTWPGGGEEDDGTSDPRYDWTAEALGDTATRLAADVTVPSPAAVLQWAAVLRWGRRAVPVAVSAACVSSVVVLAAQLNPAGSEAAPRPPYTYSMAGPEPYPATQPDGTAPVVGGPAVAAPAVPLGTSIVAVARATPLADFGISAPVSPQAYGSRAVGAAGGPAGATGPAGTATAGGTSGSGSTSGTGGTAASPPAGGAGTAPPAPGASGPVPPGPVPPTTVPSTTAPPTTVPPTTVPPTTVPPTTTTRPPTIPPPTTEPTPTTTEAPVAPTKTTPSATTTTGPAPAEPATTAAAATTTTTTKPAPTTEVTTGS